MNKNSRDSFQEFEEFFKAPTTTNQKAWGVIHDFYHMVLTYMNQHGITKADLARRLGKSRAAVSHMFNKTPNLTIKKMVEISDAIGLDIKLTSKQIKLAYGIQEDYNIVIDRLTLVAFGVLRGSTINLGGRTQEGIKEVLDYNVPLESIDMADIVTYANLS